jgi:biotin carboxylase
MVVTTTMMMVAMALTMMMMVVITMITIMMMMMDRFVDKIEMRRYHDSIIVSCVSYSENTFSHRLIAFLDGLSCPVDDDA